MLPLIKHFRYCILLVATIAFTKISSAQVGDSTLTQMQITGDTLQTPDSIDKKIDSVLNTHSPRKAAIRSAIIPGWGQAYNKRYWKIPIVYGALGTAAGVFIYNIKNYRELRFAYQAKYKASLPVFDPANPRPGPFRDSTDYFRIEPKLLPFDQIFLRVNRDDFRRNVDYSVIAFLVLWGLNVVDATVDAHLKSFDVSPDLTFRIKPGFSELGNTHGVSLILAFK
jgi:hypothetical protein